MKPNEWSDVVEWMWRSRNTFNGLSVLPYDDAEHSYVQAPFEEITKEEFDRRYKALENVDLGGVIEMDDMTSLKDSAACAGGSCEVVNL